MEPEHEQIGCRIGDLKEVVTNGFRSLHERLDNIDERTRGNEAAIAALNERTCKSNRRSLIIGGTGGLISGTALLEAGKWIAAMIHPPK